MNAVQGMLSSPRVNRWLPWFAAAVLVAGLITFMAVRNTGRPAPADTSLGGKAQNAAVAEKSVPLTKAQRLVAGRFILTAVKRHNLAEGYRLSGPDIRQGMSLKQWMKGDIAVTPFLPPIDVTTVHAEYSYKTEALLKVIIVPKGNGKAYTFLMTLKKYGKGAHARWLVDDWQPTGKPDIPLADR
jgi:hypothetical protein